MMDTNNLGKDRTDRAHIEITALNFFPEHRRYLIRGYKEPRLSSPEQSSRLERPIPGYESRSI
jgi:hypothetical protein